MTMDSKEFFKRNPRIKVIYCVKDQIFLEHAKEAAENFALIHGLTCEKKVNPGPAKKPAAKPKAKTTATKKAAKSEAKKSNTKTTATKATGQGKADKE